MGKVFSPEKAVSEIESARSSGKKIVFTNGCFDILHAGHVDYLRKARAMGDVLVVAVNTDSSVKRIKGDKRPLNSQEDRASVIAALDCVDYVTFFDEDTPYEIIKRIRPDVLVKGGDWEGNVVGSDVVTANGGEVRTVELLPGRSTTELIDKILKVYGS